MLQSRVRSTGSGAGGATTDNSSDHERRPSRRSRLSVLSSDAHLSPIAHREPNPCVTIPHQLTLVQHTLYSARLTSMISQSKQHLIKFSAQDFPSFLSCFPGLERRPIPIPCRLFRQATRPRLSCQSNNLRQHLHGSATLL